MSTAEAVRALLKAAEPNTYDREGLSETPERAAKAWDFFTSGYDVDIGGLFKSFEDGAEKYNGIVAVGNIPVYSKCEHHLETIWGVATVGYLPRNRVVGLSKLARVVDAFSRRLQVQERLTSQIAAALETSLDRPMGVGVVLHCRHMCMESRGVQVRGTITTTSSMLGEFLTKPSLRQEFMHLAVPPATL